MTKRAPRQALTSDPYRTPGGGPRAPRRKASEMSFEDKQAGDLQRALAEARGMRNIADKRAREMKALRARFVGLREDCLSTFGGGYKNDEEHEIFRHGMVTVCNVIDSILKDDDPTDEGASQEKVT